jgi:hypothetical protein
MPAGNVGYTDTRSFSGSLLGDIAGGIRDRVGNSMQMARAERANASKALNVGGRNDGITQEEFDKEYGRGHFFKRALGSNFGGDRIARTRGYFEKNPPAGRDPTGTRESRFSAGFDYASKEGLIKGARPLQGPKAPEYLYGYDRRYADVLGDAAKFKDDTLDKEKMKAKSSMFGGGTAGVTDTRSFGKKDKDAIPVEDKQLTENIAKSLSGVEIQMTRLEQKMQSGDGEDGFVANLVSKNSAAIVAGFTGIHAALSSLLGAVQRQTQAIKDGAEKRKIADEKAEDKANRREEESDAEVLNGGVGNQTPEKLKKEKNEEGGILGSLFDLISGRDYINGKRTKTKALTRLLRRKTRGIVNPKMMLLLGGLLAGGAGAGRMVQTGGRPPDPTGRTPSAGPTSYADQSGGLGFYSGGQIPGAMNSGDAFQATLGDTPYREDIIPRSPENERMSAEAKLKAEKKYQKQSIEIKEKALREYGDKGGWKELGDDLLNAIGGLFGGGPGGDPNDPTTRTTASGNTSSSASQKSTAQLMYSELVDKQGLSPDAARLMISEMGRENSLNRDLILGTHDDGGKTAYGAVSWQNGRENMLLDNLAAAGHDRSVEGLRMSGDEGVKINAATMFQDIKQRGQAKGGGHQELANLIQKDSLTDSEKDRVRELMKKYYFVYSEDVPIQRSRDWSDRVDAMNLSGGGTPDPPSRVSTPPGDVISPLLSLAPATSPLAAAPEVSVSSIFLKNQTMQSNQIAGLTLPMPPSPLLPGGANGAGGDVTPGAFSMFGTQMFYTPSAYGIE